MISVFLIVLTSKYRNYNLAYQKTCSIRKFCVLKIPLDVFYYRDLSAENNN